MHRITQLLIGREISVFATCKLLHAFIYSHSEVKNFAKDLIQVFPINEFAIRSFSHAITSYPASGVFVGKKKRGRTSMPCVTTTPLPTPEKPWNIL